MTITKIKRIASTCRFNVYVDGKYCGVFLDEILATYKLKTDQEIDEDEFKKIKEENDEKVSFDMAASYLEKYVVSEKGLKDYLKKKNFSPKTISKCIEKLKEYGFLNDEAFAQNYFEIMQSKNGKNAIARKLKQKGVSAEIVDGLLENIVEEDEIEKAVCLAKKFVKNREISPKTKQKCLAHLVYKGYDYSVAQQATNIALSNVEEEDDWV